VRCEQSFEGDIPICASSTPWTCAFTGKVDESAEAFECRGVMIESAMPLQVAR